MVDSDSASEFSEQKSKSNDDGEVSGEGTDLESLKVERCFSTTVKRKNNCVN